MNKEQLIKYATEKKCSVEIIDAKDDKADLERIGIRFEKNWVWHWFVVMSTGYVIYYESYSQNNGKTTRKEPKIFLKWWVRADEEDKIQDIPVTIHLGLTVRSSCSKDFWVHIRKALHPILEAHPELEYTVTDSNGCDLFEE